MGLARLLLAPLVGRRHQRQVFPGDGRRGQRRDFGVVVGRRHLDHVHADESEVDQPAQDALHLPGGQPADLGRAGARRKGRIERIDIEAEIGGRLADDLDDALGDGRRAHLVDRLGVDDGDALFDGPVADVLVDRRADADLDRAVRVDELGIDGVVEDRAVGVVLAEVLRPGVDVGVEMDERQRRALPLGRDLEQRQRDAVIAAQNQ